MDTLLSTSALVVGRSTFAGQGIKGDRLPGRQRRGAEHQPGG
jgi:hypothetical protein